MSDCHTEFANNAASNSQASFEGMLNLEPWACEEVVINLAAVNKFGQTENLAPSQQIVEVNGGVQYLLV